MANLLWLISSDLLLLRPTGRRRAMANLLWLISSDLLPTAFESLEVLNSKQPLPLCHRL